MAVYVDTSESSGAPNLPDDLAGSEDAARLVARDGSLTVKVDFQASGTVTYASGGSVPSDTETDVNVSGNYTLTRDTSAHSNDDTPGSGQYAALDATWGNQDVGPLLVNWPQTNIGTAVNDTLTRTFYIDDVDFNVSAVDPGFYPEPSNGGKPGPDSDSGKMFFEFIGSKSDSGTGDTDSLALAQTFVFSLLDAVKTYSGYYDFTGVWVWTDTDTRTGVSSGSRNYDLDLTRTVTLTIA